MVIGTGSAERSLPPEAVRRIVESAVATFDARWRRILVVVPDGTRTMPLPPFVDLFEQLLAGRVEALDYLVALGTHRAMSDEQLSRLLGRRVVGGRAGASRVFNHCGSDPAGLVELGTIPAAEVASLSGGRLAEDLPVRLNRLTLAYDALVVCGPVYPHEVVGFSGGNKYFFPGIAGPEVTNLTHWLGALITSFEVIGEENTPVRALIDRAASLIDRPKRCFAAVVTGSGIAGLYFGEPREAWEAAAALSARVHIVRVTRPLRRVLAVMPEMYEDLWTAAKGRYKVEPAVADGGEVVIYAPHLSEISYAHGEAIEAIGYHCRDYFVMQWDRFKHVPVGVLAHSTHLKGLGRFDPATGIETPRITVTLATGIPEERCRRLNLGYLDPAGVDVGRWKGREDDGVLVVPHAGEMLYRLEEPVAAGARRREEER